VDDPIARHPTRGEQLDILTNALAGIVRESGGVNSSRVLDIGCGTGFVAHGLMAKAPGVVVDGVDLSQDALDAAQTNLESSAGTFTGVCGDLMAVEDITLPASGYDVVYSCLTFHDLTDEGKQAVFGWVAKALRPGGYFLLYDRLRLTSSALFPLQRSIWSQIEARHGVAMRSADSFDAYCEDLKVGNSPASLVDYMAWFEAAGFDATCLHVHGNIALLGGALR
jgi:tRNA (cmo5U34)-methyltransferase